MAGTIPAPFRTAAKLLGCAWSTLTGGPRPTAPDARRRIIVFTRHPEPGRAKTRLAPALGERGAAELQRRMAELVVEQVLRLARRMAVRVEVRFRGSSDALMRQWMGTGFDIAPQEGADLGESMDRAFAAAFAGGARRVLIVGSDCPFLDTDLLEEAFNELERRALVLGPARDGGYWLIGLRRRMPRLFRGVPWGTDAVLRRTIASAHKLGVEPALLRELPDVDRPEDLGSLAACGIRVPGRRPRPRISVVVPTLNEESNIEETLACVSTGRNVEAIVVDGGSKDDTRRAAERAGARVLIESGGRARQLNRGAEAATGPLLLFLHADTRLPPGWDVHARRLSRRARFALGAFPLSIDGPGLGLRLVERWVNARSRHYGLPYGDQALFLRAETFVAVGGFPDMPLMEDYEFVRRVRRRGEVVIASRPVLTSARRWLDLGVTRTTFVNHATVLAYRLGVSPSRLAARYRGRTSSADG